MKNLATLLLIFFISISFGINLDTLTNDSTIYTCSDTLYDSGGPSGDYQSSEDYSITFCSTNGDCLEIVFLEFDMETTCDYLYIYDGTSSSDSLLTIQNGSTLPPNVTSSGSCITIVVHTDGSVTHSGFALTVNCTGNCYVPPPPPTNNDPCSAYTLQVDTFCNAEVFTTVGATSSVVDTPWCEFNYAGGDVWFEATVPASGFLAVGTFVGSMPNGGISIYSGTDCDSLTEILCEEAWSGFPGEQIIMASAGLAGQTVWIRVWEPNNDEQGTFSICAYEPLILLDVDTSIYTPQELIEDVFAASCENISNINYNGSDSAIGYFTNGNIFGLDSGIVLSNGLVTDISGEDTYTDELNYNNSDTLIVNDLLAVSNNNSTGVTISSINDVAILEFDFIPSSDTAKFNFVFASEEYQAFECTSYNDAFAFFFSGPNINGQYTDNAVNIALVPGTTDPITVTTINGVSSCGPDNSQYYLYNTASLIMNTNGFTTPLTAEINGLMQNETYHIRIVIGDGGDGILNSYIFLEAKSFYSGCVTSVNDTKLNDILIYPVPTKNTLNINYKNKQSTYKIVDLGGNIVKTGIIKKGKNILDLKLLPEGMYILFIEDSLITKKIIIN